MLRELILAGCAAMAAGAQRHDVGGRRQLFIDQRFVEGAKGIAFRVHPPVKTGEVNIDSPANWGLGGYHSVLEAGGVYYMWYTAGAAVCYARSRDGIHWTKPPLELTTDETPKPNNVVIGRGAGGVKGGTHGLMVFLDPKAPEEERFRLVANPPEFDRMVQVFSSPDGIHWKVTHRDAITFDKNAPHHLDTQNVIFWDARLGRYVAYVRKNLREAGSQGRTVARAESDGLSFGDAAKMPVVFRAGRRHPGHFDPLRKTKVAVLDVYTSSVIAYPWADGAYFMFPTPYYHYGAWQREFREAAPVNAGAIDVRFAASRDGIAWETYDWKPFVALGMEGEFDSRRNYMVYGIVPALNGRDMYMYYMGTNETHGWGRDDRNNKLLEAANLAPRPVARAISRVVLRRDGFVSVRAGEAGGEFTTPAMKFKGNQLVLNVDTSAAGEVQVEVQDESGKPIEGFTLADCDIIHTANEIDRPVKWNGAGTLEKLEGRAVRLRFVLRDADLYAFQFRERPAF
ncbi:MAG: hypothetical protein ACE15B_00670 [Bryobacteraceae bacterium]